MVTGYTLTDDTYVCVPETFPTMYAATDRTRELPWSVAHWRISDPDGRPVADWEHDTYTYTEIDLLPTAKAGGFSGGFW